MYKHWACICDFSVCAYTRAVNRYNQHVQYILNITRVLIKCKVSLKHIQRLHTFDSFGIKAPILCPSDLKYWIPLSWYLFYKHIYLFQEDTIFSGGKFVLVHRGTYISEAYFQEKGLMWNFTVYYLRLCRFLTFYHIHYIRFKFGFND